MATSDIGLAAPGPGVPKAAGRPTKLDVVPVRHWTRGTVAVVVVILLLLGLQGLATNPNFVWPIVWQYLFSPAILQGLGATLLMSLLSMVFTLILAVIIGVMRVSESRILRAFAWGYVFFFRAIPLIVLLIFVGNLGLFFRDFVIGIPFTDIVFVSVPVREIMTPFWASVIGLTLAGSGYSAEIVRGGLLSIGRGQHEAAKSLGLNGAKTLRYIILPQALRVIIPPLGNEFIGVIKAAAIVSVIAGGDLLTVALGISANNFRTLEMLMVVTIWYLICVAVLSTGQFFIERRIKER